MKRGLIIFDFDGVLADSFDSFFSLTRAGMKFIGLSLTPDQYRNLFMGNVHQGLMGFINNEEKYSAYSEFRKNNYDKYYKVRLFSGVVESLKQLQKNYILTITSSGNKTNILNLLNKNNADNLFDLILATNEYTKENMVKETIAKFKVAPKETIMITDTVGDIKIAKEFGLKTIAVTWGFHSEKMLKSSDPNFVAQSFEELQKILNQQLTPSDTFTITRHKKINNG